MALQLSLVETTYILATDAYIDGQWHRVDQTSHRYNTLAEAQAALAIIDPRVKHQTLAKRARVAGNPQPEAYRTVCLELDTVDGQTTEHITTETIDRNPLV